MFATRAQLRIVGATARTHPHDGDTPRIVRYGMPIVAPPEPFHVQHPMICIPHAGLASHSDESPQGVSFEVFQLNFGAKAL